MSMVERINKAYEYLLDTGRVHMKKDVAEIMNTKAPNISSALKGNPRFLTEGFIVRFNNAFDGIFNESWLLTGEGPMLTEDTIVPESKFIKSEGDEYDELKQTIVELNKRNETLTEANARLSVTIERLTELLYEKTAIHA